MRRVLVIAAGVLTLAGGGVWLGSAPAGGSALPVLPGPSLRTRIDPDLSQVLTTLGRRRGEVRCWSPADWRRRSAEFAVHAGTPDTSGRELAGYLSLDRTGINLPARTCDLLSSARTAAAVKVFAHELQHFRGVRDEATAECYGIQFVDDVALALGADGASARALALMSWAELYVHEDIRYRSPACYDGGPLDLRPNSPVWP